jgi:DNA-binding MarR family transcriptional regulator
MQLAQLVLRGTAGPQPAVTVDMDDARARIAPPHGEPVEFRLLELPRLSVDRAREDAMTAAAASTEPLLVVYEHGSEEARQLLRQHGISFAGADGRWFVIAPSLFIDRDRPLRRIVPTGPDDVHSSPFALRMSRVPRWLLLHPRESFSLKQIANAVQLNMASVSRAVSALHDAALVEVADDRSDRRSKRVSVARPRELLEAWRGRWQHRRLRRFAWDVGSRDADETLDALRSLRRSDPAIRWTVGGLAGAALVVRAVEPRDVVVWAPGSDVAQLADTLLPASTTPSRAGMRVVVAPDPFVLDLAVERDGLPVADPVQLWLDCAAEGERALEAADALSRECGW